MGALSVEVAPSSAAAADLVAVSFSAFEEDFVSLAFALFWPSAFLPSLAFSSSLLGSALCDKGKEEGATEPPCDTSCVSALSFLPPALSAPDDDPDEDASFLVHLAYSVKSDVTAVAKSYAFVHAASVYQPAKV